MYSCAKMWVVETFLGGNALVVVVLDSAISLFNLFARDSKLDIGLVPSDKVVSGALPGDPLYVLCLDGPPAGGAGATGGGRMDRVLAFARAPGGSPAGGAGGTVEGP